MDRYCKFSYLYEVGIITTAALPSEPVLSYLRITGVDGLKKDH